MVSVGTHIEAKYTLPRKAWEREKNIPLLVLTVSVRMREVIKCGCDGSYTLYLLLPMYLSFFNIMIYLNKKYTNMLNCNIILNISMRSHGFGV